jgi:hypothetical protein
MILIEHLLECSLMKTITHNSLITSSKELYLAIQIKALIMSSSLTTSVNKCVMQMITVMV